MTSVRSLILSLVVLLVAVHPAAAQVVVSGIVSDAETGETLPAANVQVEGTYRGTISNDEGVYQIEAEQLPVTLVVRFVGYQTVRRTVAPEEQEAGVVQLDLALQPAVYQMAEVTVSGEDPAVRIMREVIRRKQQWRSDLETYRARAYNRFTFRKDTGIVAIVETITDAFWDQKEGMREVVLSRRETDNMNVDQMLPAAALMTNYYDDDIPVAGHRLVGVTHPEALDVYDFRLAGTRVMDEQVVYDIDVRPKRKTASAFVGRVSVLGEEYALLEVRLEPGPSFVFPPPFERMEVDARQQFTNSGGEFWLPVDYRSHVVLKVGMGALVDVPTIYLDQVSRLTDYDVNVALPDSLYDQDEDGFVHVDSASVAVDTLLNTAAAVPLTPLEVRAYNTVDSTLTMASAYEPTGPMARFIDVEVDDGSGDAGEEGGRDWIDVQPRLWYNRVEALHGGASIEVRPVGVLSMEGHAGFSTGLDGAERWSYGGQSTIRFGPDRRAFAEVGVDVGARPLTGSNFYSRAINSLNVLLTSHDYLDYYRGTRLSARVGYRFEPWNVTFAVAAGAEEPSSVESSTGYDLLGDEAAPRFNPAVPDGAVRHLGVELALGGGACLTCSR